MLSLPAAREYVQRGWCVIPIPLKSKRPILPQWQKLKLKPDELDTYFKVDCNVGVLLGEASDGLIDIDLDCAESIALAREILPPTSAVFGRASKPRSHWLYYAEGQRQTNRFKDVDGQTIVEYRATGGQTVFPASIHESGEAIEWAEDGTPARIEAVDLFERVSILAAAAIIRRHWPVKGRHDACLALAGGMMRSGWMEADVLWFIEAATIVSGRTAEKDRTAAVKDTFRNFDRKEEKVTGWRKFAEILGERLVRQVREYLPAKEQPKIEEVPPEIKIETNGHKPIEFETEKPFTDYGNAERLVAEHGEMIRYCKAWKEWFIWKGSHWQRDKTGEITRRAKKTVRNMYATASEIEDNGIRKLLVEHARKSEASGKIAAMIGLAETEEEVIFEIHTLDADPWLIACPNGTVDLKTGLLRPAKQEDIITRVTQTAFNPEAQSPQWEAFLGAIFENDMETIKFVQKAVGYSLTGQVSQRMLFILHGKGRNGKSTFLETLKAVIGSDYAATTSSELLLTSKQGNEAPLYLAELQGVRFVVASETEDGRKLAAAALKHATGNDEVPARKHYAQPYSYKPQFKLWLATNHMPEPPSNNDTALWDRLREIPFNVRIPDLKVDLQLPEKLLTEREGILAWGVRGCLMWQSEGLESSKKIIEATTKYKKGADVFQEFFDEYCEMDADAETPSSHFAGAFAAWCKENGERVKTRKWLGDRLKDLGLENYQATHGEHKNKAVWIGARILKNWRVEDRNQRSLLDSIPVEDGRGST